MKRDSPTVSVVIPTRDRWALLPRALGSALDQEAVTVEVIVVDDGSDRAMSTPRLDDPRVKLVRHQQTRGVAAARNSGMREASARWVAFLDDDDLWAPHRLRSILDALAHASADFGYCASITVDERFRPLMGQPVPDERKLMDALLRHNAIPGGGSNVVARDSLLEQTGEFDESFSFLADWDMWIRLAEIGRPVAVPEPLIAYLHHSRSWALREAPAITELQRLIEKHAALSRRHGVAVNVLEFDCSVAHRLWLARRRGPAARRYLAAAWNHRNPGSLLRAIRAFLTPDLAHRLGLARERPQSPEWLEHLAASYSVGVPD